MKLSQIYRMLLHLYPRDYQAMFALEMSVVFEQLSKDHRQEGKTAFLRYFLRELVRLILGIGAEWIAKWTTDPSVRGRTLPDLRVMRPPGVPRELWFAATRRK